MATPAVRFGLSLTTAHPLTADPQQCLHDLLERVEVAREAGFHSIWVGDHHVTATNHYFRAPGCDHFLFRHIVREQERMLESIRLIGERVVPHFARGENL